MHLQSIGELQYASAEHRGAPICISDAYWSSPMLQYASAEHRGAPRCICRASGSFPMHLQSIGELPNALGSAICQCIGKKHLPMHWQSSAEHWQSSPMHWQWPFPNASGNGVLPMHWGHRVGALRSTGEPCRTSAEHWQSPTGPWGASGNLANALSGPDRAAPMHWQMLLANALAKLPPRCIGKRCQCIWGIPQCIGDVL